MEFSITGVDKDLLVKDSNVHIHQKKAFFQSENNKVLQIIKISSVQIKRPTSFMNGYIRFSIIGGFEKDYISINGGIFATASHENSVIFIGEDNYQIAIEIKEYIENYESGKSNLISYISPADEIRKFKALADEGIISLDEFEKEKNKLLGL